MFFCWPLVIILYNTILKLRKNQNRKFSCFFLFVQFVPISGWCELCIILCWYVLFYVCISPAKVCAPYIICNRLIFIKHMITKLISLCVGLSPIHLSHTHLFAINWKVIFYHFLMGGCVGEEVDSDAWLEINDLFELRVKYLPIYLCLCKLS